VNTLVNVLQEVLEGHPAQLMNSLLQFAIARSLEDDNNGEERLRRLFPILQESDDDTIVGQMWKDFG
jgi:hypothetical protein